MTTAHRKPVACGVAAVVLGVAGCGPAPSTPALRSELVNSIGMSLVRLPAGSFQMGSQLADAAENERPTHRVTLSRPFWIGRHEVTQSQYTAVMGANPSRYAPTGDQAAAVAGLDTGDFPVDHVTWEEATEFCRRLTESPAERAAGRSYRLPTEAEWEYACRAGSGDRFATGDKLGASQANVAAAAGVGRPSRVGSYQPNAWGLYDLHGNVWEWCADGERRYSSWSATDPVGPATVAPVVRGGAWDFPGGYARSASRQPALRGYVFFGFRVVCDAPTPQGDPR